MDFLELIETLHHEQATVERLFGGEGESARKAKNSAAYTQKLIETTQFLHDLTTGRKPAYMLREAMTTSDFPYLFGDVLDRQLLAAYTAFPTTWQNYIKKSMVRDFRTVRRLAMDGANAVLTEVAEKAEYPAASMSETNYTYAVKKYGRRVPFSWEAMINDDIGALREIPKDMAIAARRSEEKFATELFVDSSGPHASVYTEGNANIVTSNPALSAAALGTAMTVIGNMVDGNSEPIVIEQYHLVVPPALKVAALQIINATEIYVSSGSAGGTEYRTANWMKNNIQVHVNPYITIVATTNGDTSWFLFADPVIGRPAAELGFLIGHESPEIFIKQPNAQRVGGGVNPMDGDFDTDSVEYKVRHIFGGSMLDPKMTVGSEGDGS